MPRCPTSRRWLRAQSRSEPSLLLVVLPVSERQQGPHQPATTAGCEASWGGSGPGSSPARPDRERGAGTGLHKSTRHSGRRHALRSWGKFGDQGSREAPGSRLTARGAALASASEPPTLGFLGFLGPGSELRAPPHAARPDGHFSLSQSQDVWAVRLKRREISRPAGTGQLSQATQRWSPRHSPGRAVEQR